MSYIAENTLRERLRNEIITTIVNSPSTDNGLFQGLSGIILLLSCDRQNKYLDIIEEKINIIYNDISGFSSSSLCNGLVGFGYLISYLSKKNLLVDNVEFSRISNILEIEFEMLRSRKNFDYLHGYLGIVNYFIYTGKLNKNIIEKIYHEFENLTLFLYDDNCPPPNRYSDDDLTMIANFGLAHGIPSILCVLINFDRASKTIGYKKINDLTNYIFQHRRTDKISRYPGNLYITPEANESRLAWCYGDLGVNMALLKSARYLGDSTLEKQVVADLIYTTKRTHYYDTMISDCTFCHGCSGVSYMYRQLFELYQNIEFKEAYTLWEQKILEAYKISGFNALLSDKAKSGYKLLNGFLDGIAGVLFGLQLDQYDNEIFNHIMLIDI